MELNGYYYHLLIFLNCFSKFGYIQQIFNTSLKTDSAADNINFSYQTCYLFVIIIHIERGVFMLRGIKAAIFDMDGTIIDSMWIWNEIDIKFLQKR
ncbi:MAG: hypothetical protein PWP66_502 [Thermosediminibacterales bacterium]|jgi:hypothetical protein|nr:hypothetical protein [Thermosediminibacterales bacterium]